MVSRIYCDGWILFFCAKCNAEMTTNSYTERMMRHSIKDREIYFCDGELDEFIAVANYDGFDYDYCKTEDGFDFMAWNPEDEESVARIKL